MKYFTFEDLQSLIIVSKMRGFADFDIKVDESTNDAGRFVLKIEGHTQISKFEQEIEGDDIEAAKNQASQSAILEIFLRGLKTYN